MILRSWSVVAIIILANWIVFSILATVVFPPALVTAPVHALKPTFTPGLIDLKLVGPLTYTILTPTATTSPTEALAETAVPTQRR